MECAAIDDDAAHLTVCFGDVLKVVVVHPVVVERERKASWGDVYGSSGHRHFVVVRLPVVDVACGGERRAIGGVACAASEDEAQGFSLAHIIVMIRAVVVVCTHHVARSIWYRVEVDAVLIHDDGPAAHGLPRHVAAIDATHGAFAQIIVVIENGSNTHVARYASQIVTVACTNASEV